MQIRLVLDLILDVIAAPVSIHLAIVKESIKNDV